jgi:hypothetical protein
MSGLTGADLRNTVIDLKDIHASLIALYDSSGKMMSFDDSAFCYLLKLIGDDLGSVIDDINRKNEGRCTIRGALPEVLRPPLQWVRKPQPDEYDHVPVSVGGVA